MDDTYQVDSVFRMLKIIREKPRGTALHLKSSTPVTGVGAISAQRHQRQKTAASSRPWQFESAMPFLISRSSGGCLKYFTRAQPNPAWTVAWTAGTEVNTLLILSCNPPVYPQAMEVSASSGEISAWLMCRHIFRLYRNEHSPSCLPKVFHSSLRPAHLVLSQNFALVSCVSFSSIHHQSRFHTSKVCFVEIHPP